MTIKKKTGFVPVERSINMFYFLGGLVTWVGVIFFFLYLARNEPTTHGRAVGAQYGIIIGFILAAVVWLIGIGVYLF